MDINIYVNHTKAIDMGIEGIIKKHMNNGEMCIIFKECWNLRETPIISNVNVQRIGSSAREQSTVNIEGGGGGFCVSSNPVSNPLQMVAISSASSVPNTPMSGSVAPVAPFRETDNGSVVLPRSRQTAGSESDFALPRTDTGATSVESEQLEGAEGFTPGTGFNE